MTLEVPDGRRHGVRFVDDPAALLATPFDGGCSAICWRRALAGDFDEVVRLLGDGDPVETLDEARLAALPVSAAGAAAVATLLADLRLLRAAGHAPTIECVRAYPRDTRRPVATDVHSFHVDSSTVPAVTFLCSYAGAASEGLADDQARRLVDVPAIRSELLAQFGGDDGAAFAAHLAAEHFDVHYQPLPGARPFSFGRGHLWKIAVEYPGCPVRACIHRAPPTAAGAAPRLLLIS